MPVASIDPLTSQSIAFDHNRLATESGPLSLSLFSLSLSLSLSLPLPPPSLPPPSQLENPRQTTPVIVQNLISLTQNATHGELASLEELIGLLVKGKYISAPVVKMLWDIFTRSVNNVTQSHSRSAILLLSMIASAEREIVKANIKVIVAHGLNSNEDTPGN